MWIEWIEWAIQIQWETPKQVILLQFIIYAYIRTAVKLNDEE